jgi:PGDYG protein
MNEATNSRPPATPSGDGLPDLSEDAAALRVCKRPDPVRVHFASEDGLCTTLEGDVRYRAGDAVLTGMRGENWPVRRDLFLAAYQAVSPTVGGEDGLYVKEPSLTYALRVEQPRTVPVGWQSDPLQARAGNWLLQYADGSYSVIQDDIFRASYGPASAATPWPPE